MASSEQIDKKVTSLSLIFVGTLLIILFICLLNRGSVAKREGITWVILWFGLILAIRGMEVICEKPERTGQVEPTFMYETRRMMLIEEYRELTSAVARRASQYATVESLLISSSLLAVSFVFSGRAHAVEDAVKSATLIASILLVVLACALAITTTAIDSMFWKRIREIEGEVGIEWGHRLLYLRVIRGTTAFRLRRIIWPTIFSSLLTFYFYLLYTVAAF